MLGEVCTMNKAQCVEVEPINIDIKVKCKCGKIFRDIDKDFNDWTECPTCYTQYKVHTNFKEQDVELEEI